MNFQDSLNNWLGSNKYKEFKAKLNKKKEELFNMKPSHLRKMKNPKVFETLDELERAIDTRMYLSILEEECEQADFILTESMNLQKKEDHYYSIIQTLVTWYYYLVLTIKTEDFELASKLRDVIAIEIKDFLIRIKLHKDYDQEDDQDSIINIDTYLKEFYQICS